MEILLLRHAHFRTIEEVVERIVDTGELNRVGAIGSTFSCLRSPAGPLLDIRTSLGLRSSVHRYPSTYLPLRNLARRGLTEDQLPLPRSVR